MEDSIKQHYLPLGESVEEYFECQNTRGYERIWRRQIWALALFSILLLSVSWTGFLLKDTPPCQKYGRDVKVQYCEL
jgi:hypothetical protein